LPCVLSSSRQRRLRAQPSHTSLGVVRHCFLLHPRLHPAPFLLSLGTLPISKHNAVTHATVGYITLFLPTANPHHHFSSSHHLVVSETEQHHLPCSSHLVQPSMSTNGPIVFGAAQNDAALFGAGPVDLKNISESEARRLMSEEHKILGYRPPPGSLAAEAQAAAAKHSGDVSCGITAEQIRQAALADALRIKKEREAQDEGAARSVDLSKVGEAEARKLMSEEHKALGHRPPPGSLAAQAQAAAAKHPKGNGNGHPATHDLQRAALEDAAKIDNVAATLAGIDLNFIGEVEARKIMSEEHKALGYRPPPGSLAAEAQAAAAKHPHASAGLDPTLLTKAALEDAKKIESSRRLSGGSSSSERPINLKTITAEEAHKLQSEEQKVLGYRPPSDSLAAQAQNAVDKRADVSVTKEMSADIQSDEQKELGHRPEAGSIAAVAQNFADKNENEGGDRTLGEAGL